MGVCCARMDSCKDERDEHPRGRVVIKEGFWAEAMSQLVFEGCLGILCTVTGGKGAPHTKA